MTEENKKRTKLTISNLGKSALKAGAQGGDDTGAKPTTVAKETDCIHGFDTRYNDTGPAGKTLR